MSLHRFVCPALALGLLAAVTPATATRLELQAGRSYTDSNGANTAFVEAVFAPRTLGRTRFVWSPDVSVGWIDGRHLKHHAGPYDSRASVALLAAGARVHMGSEGRWYHPLYFSGQIAATNHTTHALSSHYQFVSTLGWQAKHFNVAIRHISNGSLNGPNAGETMALVGVAFDI